MFEPIAVLWYIDQAEYRQVILCVHREWLGECMKTKRTMYTTLSLLMLLLGGCSKSPLPVQSFAMDTLNTITVYSEADKSIASDCLALLDEYDAKWSSYREGSDIYQLNQYGQAVLTGDTAEILLAALQYALESGGAFDPAIFPIASLWHLNTRTGDEPLPDEQAIRNACKLVDFNDITVVGQSDGSLLITMQSGMGIDLGGIAKGFVADKLKVYLLNRGVKNAIISLGGNVCLIGSETYTVGLEDPRADGIFGKLRLSNVHIVTSGDYQRYIDIDGQRIHHIFDPKTGYSVHNGLCSVTIIGQNGAQCDALSTAVFVLGLDEGMALVESQGLDAVLVTEDGRIYLTDGIRDVFTLVNTAYDVQ